MSINSHGSCFNAEQVAGTKGDHAIQKQQAQQRLNLPFFPIFFLIFYAIITYGLIFAAQQTLALAAAEGKSLRCDIPRFPRAAR